MIDKEGILSLVDDTVSNFLYYDRKGDEECGVGDIELSIKLGVVSLDDITNRFRLVLEKSIL